MKTVSDLICGQDITTVSRHQTVLEAARLMTDKRIGAVPVLDDRERMVGILSERDLMNRVIAQELDPARTTVEQVMTRNLITGVPEDDLNQVIRTMKQAGIRHLPILAGQKLTGIVSLRDLLLVDLDEKDEELNILTAYINYIPPMSGS